jgi:hypothetical protein
MDAANCIGIIASKTIGSFGAINPIANPTACKYDEGRREENRAGR